MTRRFAVRAGGVVAIGRPALVLADTRIRLRLAHALPRTHPVHPAMEYMARLVRERSAGAIEITLFADGELGQEIQLIERVRTGGLDLAKVSASVLERWAPAHRVFGVPFLIRDGAHWHATVTGPIGEEILGSGLDAGLVGLTFYQSGVRSFYGNRPIRTPEDLQGMKIRIQPSSSMSRMVAMLGAQPVQLPWAATYSALQTGLVDGAENNIAALIVGRHAEVVRFYSSDEHTAVPDVLVMGARRWTGLSEALRRILREAAWDSFSRMNELWGVFEAEARRAAERLRVMFLQPDKQGFVERTAALRDEHAGDSETGALLRRIQGIV